MTIDEVCRRYVISMDTLKEYEQNGLLNVTKNENGEYEYRESDFNSLGLISILLDVGFTFKEIKKYISLMNETGACKERVRILREKRKVLLSEIRQKQKTFDQLDYIIREEECSN